MRINKFLGIARIFVCLGSLSLRQEITPATFSPLPRRRNLLSGRNTTRLTFMSRRKTLTTSSPVFWPLLEAPKPSKASSL
jgi:hypothetical protein